MKTTSVQLSLLLLAAVSLLSCRKETVNSAANVHLLTQASWSYDEFGIDQNLDGLIDIPEGFEDCAMDDLVKFDTGGSGNFDQGASFCYPDFPQSLPFDWSFQNNDTQIEYGGTLHTILTLSETQLAIYTEEDNGGSAVRHILVYRR